MINPDASCGSKAGTNPPCQKIEGTNPLAYDVVIIRDGQGVLTSIASLSNIPVVQGLAMELATDIWHFEEQLDPKHSSLAHQQESGQADP